jgi:hypothetical protein
MQNKQGSGKHEQKGGHQQGQQHRGQTAQDDRQREGGRAGGEAQRQQTGKTGNLERDKAQKGKGSPA